jgi:hypothetical protein
MDDQQAPPTRAPAPPADHDTPYTFGHRPRASVTYPFSVCQYARLLVLRGRVQDGLPALDAPADAA